MEKVLGIGGFFFSSKDGAALARWYTDNLGIDPTPRSYDAEPWHQEAGHTVFEPFTPPEPEDGKEGESFAWMLNFRVRDLDAMVTQLRNNGITVEIDENDYPNGRFASLKDPDGNPIQLWEPTRAE